MLLPAKKGFPCFYACTNAGLTHSAGKPQLIRDSAFGFFSLETLRTLLGRKLPLAACALLAEFWFRALLSQPSQNLSYFLAYLFVG
jgi:hypothetical protein